MKCERCPSLQCLPDCLLAKVAYCSYCATYGHFSVSCKHYKSKKTIIIEQNNKIIPNWSIGPRQITICKSEKAIRAFLYFYKLTVCQKMDTNIRNINKFCKENGWAKTVFVEPAENIDSEEDEE